MIHAPRLARSLAGALSLALAAPSLAQTGGPWDLRWSTIDTGGNTANGGPWTLSASVAQHDAGVSDALPWTLAAGFWGSSLDAAPCPTDLDDDGDTLNGLHPDGGTDINDLLSFLVLFENGDPAADLDDDGIDPQLPDGGTDINDLIYFLDHFESGC